MQPLEKILRNKLERTVKEAREIAETAARASLEQLGVGEASAYSHLSDADKELRRKLRLHGRQLGDVRNASTEVQEISRLTEEVAYEHWHRMLFARFLAENNLLMFDDVAVTMEECDDLAADEGAANGWELAARCAAKMLPQIFRTDSPVFQLTLPPEYELKLESLLAELTVEVFTASDSLGWVYQFWQSDNKERINKSETKIGARELPAVTQLFTEPYMVAFLLDNALGAWFVAKLAGLQDGKELFSDARQILKTAETEEELRKFFCLPGVPLEYLRFIRQDNGEWWPATGNFDGWPENLSELKILDPCCGSGHFLVAAFLMLVAMRMELEGLSAKVAVDVVLQDNIHGLELDRRCVELAAFALALTAWCYPEAGGYRPLPELHVACSGLAISAKKEEWLALAGDNTNLRQVLEELYKQFKDAPALGSLINPTLSLGKGSLFELKWEEVGPLLTKALSGENEDKSEIGIVAQGITKAASVLTNKYDWIVTNVPYLARGNQDDIIKDYCGINYPKSQQDLANVFIERCIGLSKVNGVISAVTPQNWLFRSRYEDHREFLLRSTVWKMLARLGPGAFDTISGHVVQAVLVMLQIREPRKTDNLIGIDASQEATTLNKAISLKGSLLHAVSQFMQLNSPGCRVTLFPEQGILLDEIARGVTGLITKDAVRFYKSFWEVVLNDSWSYGQTSVSENKSWDGLSKVVFWEQNQGVLREQYKQGISILAGGLAWGKAGVCVSQTGVLPASLYSGHLFDDTVAVIIPEDQEYVPAIWAFCESGEFGLSVRRINQALKVTPSTLVKIVFDSEHWIKVAAEKYPNGLPSPFSDDPTQWIFHGHPLRSDDPLQVSIARLLGYRWPAELDSSMEISDEARKWVNKSEELLPHADDDGIVCIPAVRGEMKAEDRLENMLAAAYNSEWSSQKKSELLAQSDHAGKSMETWLRDKFFVQHCKLFQHRPFIWHIWDGLRDGFAALVNYHKLDYKTLETLIYNYLGDWISRQKQDIANGVDGAAEKLAAAEQLKKKLELILEGDSPYDIFVRWKSLDKQPVGWNPDLNDGVRLNIRPFITAGVLRFNKKPQINVSWEKDRGKDVGSAPWCHMFDGDRINDHHLTLDQKRQAREKTS